MTVPRVVVDASAYIELLGSPEPALRHRLHTSSLVAPERIDLEIVHFLRKTTRLAPNTAEQATHIVRSLPQAPITRVPHRSLVDRIWTLRHAVTAYDAAYVALAERLDAPLVTTDAKLAHSNGHHAKIELFAAS
ncbi:Predicted nucleic acid-binding protein, contains PIN domain [Amycolatopsis arida]|uniref:Predicted nucleic acid-binding protein, contains PIN domain n=1 Tax=Amycolatopsis arida TaxID=587909 RepID=A0A1I5Z660_9PSEU|nr:type II toxin-antitoxin system VapC family toxin [Amycolatopsis arida]TDX90171.1 putative nucleic acid-binding protein [Amycolatopsis arida]SFQ51954.1 Predicted nucleic acid-binding protein, contains PIN domain [Amycolatopsis arida]